MEKETLVVREYFDSGELMLEYTVVDGIKNGAEKLWHKNGQIFVEAHYIDDLIDGLYQEWDEHGQLHQRANFMRGQFDGFYQSWWANGLPKEEGYYVSDKRQHGYRWFTTDGALWSVYEVS